MNNALGNACQVLMYLCFMVGLSLACLDLMHPKSAGSSWCPCGKWLYPRSAEPVIGADGVRRCWRCDREYRADLMRSEN